jgi:hypothetical protein
MSTIYDEVIKIYAELGLVVSRDKTIVLSMVVTFLGRIFYGGSEVLCP